MYIVIREFNDAQDNRHAYKVGDVFPHDGRKVSQERINALLNGNNFQQVPLITRVNDKPKKEVKVEDTQEVKWSAEDIQKMPFMKLKSVAKQNDVEVVDKEASAIRSELIEKLGL